jgi:hypothetical protein
VPPPVLRVATSLTGYMGGAFLTPKPPIFMAPAPATPVLNYHDPYSPFIIMIVTNGRITRLALAPVRSSCAC